MDKLDVKKIVADLADVNWIEDADEKQKAFELLKAVSADESEEAVHFVSLLKAAIDKISEEMNGEKAETKPETTEEKPPEETHEVKEEGVVTEAVDEKGIKYDPKQKLDIKLSTAKDLGLDKMYDDIKPTDKYKTFKHKSKQISIPEKSSWFNDVEGYIKTLTEEKIEDGIIVTEANDNSSKQVPDLYIDWEIHDGEEKLCEDVCEYEDEEKAKEHFTKNEGYPSHITLKRKVKENMDEAYFDGFEKQYREGNEGAKEAEALLHKYGFKMKDLDDKWKANVTKVSKKSVLTSDDHALLGEFDRYLQIKNNSMTESKEDSKEYVIYDDVLDKEICVCKSKAEAADKLYDLVMDGQEGLRIVVKEKESLDEAKKFKYTGDVENDFNDHHPLIIDLVIERIQNEYFDKVRDFKALGEYLKKRFTETYKANSSFAEKILNARGNKGMDTLEAFLNHWADAYVSRGEKTLEQAKNERKENLTESITEKAANILNEVMNDQGNSMKAGSVSDIASSLL